VEVVAWGEKAIYCKARTSIPDKTHRIYPYLLRDVKVTRADAVWCADITYIPMSRGHAYLCAVMDWHTRCVLGWAVSNTMDVALCLRALERAKAHAGCVPEIFNTDQGSQFTSQPWCQQLTEWGARISMDGKGRWMQHYNTWRPHQELGNRTPAETYRTKPDPHTIPQPLKKAA
jgi:putative transposase